MSKDMVKGDAGYLPSCSYTWSPAWAGDTTLQPSLEPGLGCHPISVAGGTCLHEPY